MKKWLKDVLICPECLDHEIPLDLNCRKEDDQDILEGHLACPECGQTYDISEGIAVVVPEATLPVTRDTRGYGSFSMLSSYLWSHYSEFFNGPDATDAYKKWAHILTQRDGWALDIGCAVGRLTFELSKTHERAVGIDTSLSFIRAARNLSLKKRLEFDMILEGKITQARSSDLDPGFCYDHVEFIVADAMALPFRSQHFATATSVNILEKVPDPYRHLKETSRIMDKKKAEFLLSDPFSWDETVSHPDLWLGGRNKGPFKGFGMDNICKLIEDQSGIFGPGFTIQNKGQVLWKIRKTRNLWEHITSEFLIALKDLI